ncbi:hypothetical protein [Paraburkholderia kururiensis]|uniref:Uncharacterized protein n=1 Tax=Paraburkholderia kururiensis TaxID=984307 RepID=A0ABZ0WEV0_9BURK|nr:hypothetical protein [Paraburkholderia kururiensis]WQD75886.1 hypothetical protein U0042_17330 [Paraburkholderia kururiensis]
MENTTKSGLLQFVDMITSKGWVNTNTGNSWNAAVKKLLGDVPDDEDVRRIDVKSQVLRYNNLHPGDLSPESLKTYEKRATTAIQQFISYKTDPRNYKAPSRGLSNGKNDKPEQRKKAATKPAQVSETSAQTTTPDQAKGDGDYGAPKTIGGTSTGTNLVLPFPLRPGYLAQVVIPIDMTKDEADRLCAFIQTLAQAKP